MSSKLKYIKDRKNLNQIPIRFLVSSVVNRNFASLSSCFKSANPVIVLVFLHLL